MRNIMEHKLTLIEDRLLELDNLVIISEEESIYELEYEYLRGKRDVLLHLLSICIE